MTTVPAIMITTIQSKNHDNNRNNNLDKNRISHRDKMESVIVTAMRGVIVRTQAVTMTTIITTMSMILCEAQRKG